jgi:hypothetical protein
MAVLSLPEVFAARAAIKRVEAYGRVIAAVVQIERIQTDRSVSIAGGVDLKRLKSGGGVAAADSVVTQSI